MASMEKIKKGTQYGTVYGISHFFLNRLQKPVLYLFF